VPATPKHNSRLSVILLLVATGIAFAANIVAPYLSYDARDQLIIVAAIIFLVAAVPICFLPAWCVPSIWALAGGGCMLALRFTGDIGPYGHFSGVLLFASLLVFTVLLAIKTAESSRELARDRESGDPN
jgi:hypothetical protein